VPNAIREVSYQVRRGDSLAAIAKRFRVSVKNIVEWNGIAAADYLQPGQRLVMFVDVTEQSS
jgi:membrane-bound lytic murein transglycosylase D